MQFLIYPIRKNGRSGWIAYDTARDIAYRFHSPRRIPCWCGLMAKRHGTVSYLEYGVLNQIDVWF